MAFNEWQIRALAQGASLALTSNGTTLVDGSANAHAVTLQGEPVPAASYMGFDGLIQSATMPGHASLEPTADCTFECLMMAEATSSLNAFGGFLYTYVPTSSLGVQLFITNTSSASENQSFSASIRVGGASTNFNSASGSITRGQIHYVAASRTGGVNSVYIDGVLQGTGNSGGGYTVTTTAKIAKGGDDKGRFRGRIYALGFSPTLAIDQAEVTARYKLLNLQVTGGKGRVAAQQV